MYCTSARASFQRYFFIFPLRWFFFFSVLNIMNSHRQRPRYKRYTRAVGRSGRAGSCRVKDCVQGLFRQSSSSRPFLVVPCLRNSSLVLWHRVSSINRCQHVLDRNYSPLAGISQHVACNFPATDELAKPASICSGVTVLNCHVTYWLFDNDVRFCSAVSWRYRKYQKLTLILL